MTKRSALMLALALAGFGGPHSAAHAVPITVQSSGDAAGSRVTPVDLGCGRGYTRGHFGACVTLHPRHDRMHGRHSGHDYDIHDRRHYHTEPHLYHGRSHRQRAHRH